MLRRPGAKAFWGHFGAVPFMRELCPERKQQAWCHWSALQGLCCPKILLVPPRVSKNTFQDEKHEWTPKRSLSFAPKTFFWSSPVNLWARGQIRTIRFRRAPPDNKRAPFPPSETCASKEGRWPAWRPLFCFFLLKLRVKFICTLPNIFSSPPIALLWRRA